jgi:polysaccharide deacetylase family protein (PEP-CTERM system associated)
MHDNEHRADKSAKNILITVDVEDWFQVENLKFWIRFETWNQRDLRVEKNVHHILDLFDSIHRRTRVNATFFILGWIAHRLPGLVREINSRGHEVGSHGINHQLSNTFNDFLLKEELTNSKKLLEDITGTQILGFRAPSFAIDNKVLEAVERAGYIYDSSFNSFSLHGRYGKIDLNGCKTSGIAYRLSDNFYELPISNLEISGYPVPWGGGAYFRFIPPVIFRQGVRRILRKHHLYLFYMHPWEIDPDQPQIGKPLSANFIKHYYNQKQTLTNLKKMICSFSDCSFTTCKDYISGLR